MNNTWWEVVGQPHFMTLKMRDGFFHQYPIKVVVSLYFPNILHFSSSSFFQSTSKSNGKDGHGICTWLTLTRRFAIDTPIHHFFFYFSFSNSCQFGAYSGQNWLKLPKHMLQNKNKNKHELISYLVINLLYNCQISCRSNN